MTDRDPSTKDLEDLLRRQAELAAELESRARRGLVALAIAAGAATLSATLFDLLPLQSIWSSLGISRAVLPTILKTIAVLLATLLSVQAAMPQVSVMKALNRLERVLARRRRGE